MATKVKKTTVPTTGAVGVTIYNVEEFNATAVALATAAAEVHRVLVDGRSNTTEDLYMGLWNTAVGSVTVGTTVPRAVLWVPKGTIVEYYFFSGDDPPTGLVFGTAITAAIVKEAGISSNTNPTSTSVTAIVHA